MAGEKLSSDNSGHTQSKDEGCPDTSIYSEWLQGPEVSEYSALHIQFLMHWVAIGL